MNRTTGTLCLVWTLTLLGGAAGAQERPAPRDSLDRLELPAAVAEAVVDFYNDPRRTRYEGDARVARGEVLRRDVAVLEGALVVEGRVEGSIVVVNGSVELRPGSTITGDLLVVGGTISGAEHAMVGGEMLSYPERLRYRREENRIIRVVPPRPRASETGGSFPWGRSDFLVTTGKSYNRVEGLPITLGPRVETAGPNPFRIHALAIYRTESGFTLDTDRMGYYVRAEQFLGGRQQIRVGGTAFSTVDPVEDWHISDLENGLATFLFHQDFRDHYEREGVSFFGLWEPRPGPLTLGGELRWERHASLPAGSPWTLFQNAEPWREQPLVAEGRLGSLAAQAVYDTRVGTADPATGWLLRGSIERSFHAELESPLAFEDPSNPMDVFLLPRLATPSEFSRLRTGMVDLRRYNRVDPESRLSFRLLLAGSLDGKPLPPQRQHALGGEGSLPGYSLFSRDCGARDELVFRPDDAGASTAFFPAYGCDAVALLQAEYRGKLAFRLRLDSAPWEDGAHESRGWGLDLDIAPDWVVFVDTGRGWTFDSARRDEALAVDVGLGILVNRIGLYVARPLTGDSGLNLFVRLGPRF